MGIDVKRLPDRVVSETVKYFQIGGHEFDEGVIPLLEELQHTDYIERINIHPEEVGAALEELGLASRSVRGSYWAADEEAIRKILHEIYETL